MHGKSGGGGSKSDIHGNYFGVDDNPLCGGGRGGGLECDISLRPYIKKLVGDHPRLTHFFFFLFSQKVKKTWQIPHKK